MPTAAPAAAPFSGLVVSALDLRCLLPRVNKAAASRAQLNWGPMHPQMELLWDSIPKSNGTNIRIVYIFIRDVLFNSSSS